MQGMFRGVIVAMSALALTSTVLVETTPGVAQAKPLAAGPIGAPEAVTLAMSTQVTSPYGPTCVDPAPTTLKFIVNVDKTVNLECTNTSIGPSPSETPTITPTPIPTPTFTPDPPEDPAPTGTPTPITNQSPEVVYVEDVTTRPLGVTVTVNSSTGRVTITGTNAAEGVVTINANQAYDISQSNYGYTGTTKIEIPISIKVAKPPTCQIFTLSTLFNDPATVANEFIDIPLTYNALQAGGCRGDYDYGALTYSYPATANGTVVTFAGNKARFTPNRGFLTAPDNSIKAYFSVIATDEYGQTSVAKSQTGADITDAIITVNVSKPRICTSSAPKTSTVFNNPLASSSRDALLKNSRFAIRNHINNMIDCTSRGQTIAMSWFSFTDDNMVNHLIQARRAGVNVRVLVNSHAIKPTSSSFTAVNTLRAALGTTITAANANASTNSGSWIKWCNSGCLTPKAKAGVVFPNDSEGEYPALHSKFFLITQSSSVKNIVGISSVNPTYEQAKVGFNNASIVVRDETLFASMSHYFADLAKAARGAGKVKAARKLKTDSKTTSYYVYPTTQADDVLTMLRNIKCVYWEAGKYKRTEIYVNMFVFTRNAPAMELWRKAFNSKLKNGGCNVHIIYTDMDQRIKALNTKTNRYAFIPNGKVPSSWGAADCLSTYPYSRTGKRNKLTGPGMVYNKELGRSVTASVCKYGSLQGAMPTINKAGGYCWYKATSKASGGSLDICVSTPLKITALDKADNRAKLEPVMDASGRRWYTHQKYIAIDGMYGEKGKQSHQKVVISGTPNLSSPGLRWNDEILTFTTSADIYDQYLANFKQIKSAIKKRPGPGPDSNPNGATASW